MAPKRVLAAVDLGPSTDSVIEEAAREAAGGALFACHVMPDLRTIRPLFPQSLVEDAPRQIALREAVRAELVSLARRHGAEPIVETGEPYAQIVSAANERSVELIVTGGPSSSSGWVAGTAERVLRYASGPVLLSRGSSDGPILVATDLSDPSLPALRAAAAVASARGRQLIALHVVEVVQWLELASAVSAAIAASIPAPIQEGRLRTEASAVLDRAIEGLSVEVETEVEAGSPAQVILDRATAHRASLVVVATHGRTGFDRVLVGSVAEAVARRAPCSVLAVRRTDEPARSSA